LEQSVGRCQRHQGPDLLDIRAKVLGDDFCQFAGLSVPAIAMISDNGDIAWSCVV
jgi:hypothetical protein